MTVIPDSTLREFPDVEQRSEEWHKQRRGIVTASVVGQLLSVGYRGAEWFECPDCEARPFTPCLSKVKRGGEFGTIKTHHSARADFARDEAELMIEPADNDTSRGLTALLAAERITGYTEETFINADMWRGIEQEPIARDWYSQYHAKVRECGFMVRRGEGWSLGFSPDGLVGDDGLIEIKSRRQKKQLTTVLAGEVPPENMPQIQCGLLVSGRKWLDYVSFSGGMHLYVKRVFPDHRWFAAIIAAVERFERTASEMVDTYARLTEGLPMTERVVEQEMVI